MELIVYKKEIWRDLKVNNDNNKSELYDVCPICEQNTLHVYTQEYGVYAYCEHCGFENKRD